MIAQVETIVHFGAKLGARTSGGYFDCFDVKPGASTERVYFHCEFTWEVYNADFVTINDSSDVRQPMVTTPVGILINTDTQILRAWKHGEVIASKTIHLQLPNL